LATAGLHSQARAVAAAEAPVEESPAQESSGPVEGILVMKSGAVVSGKIVRSGDFYKVLGPYGQGHFPAELVKLRAADLEEAYLKLSETAKSHHSANSRITLARWCLTHHLDSQARQELHEALVLEPESEDAKRLLRDAEESIKSKQKKDVSTGQPALPGRGARPASAADDETVTLGGLSHEQALQFTRRIQPLLVNTCASAGCHSRDSQNGFRLQNVSPGTTANRNATERNLAQILEHIDVKKPRSSSLLTAPGRHHGRNGRPVFVGQRGDEKLAELENWILAVARDEMQRNGRDARRKSGAERAPMATHGESRPASGMRSVAAGGKQLSDADPFAHAQSDATNSQPPLPPSSDDPFDPATFNRGNGRGSGR
jgi:hypothetical protein